MVSDKVEEQVLVAVKPYVTGSFVPDSYGWFLLSLLGVVAVYILQMSMVISARNRFGILSPRLYAPLGHKFEEKFNSIQRAHQNTIEFIPFTIIPAIATALVHPHFTASFVTVFSFGRIVYAFGYAKSPKNRSIGWAISTLGGTLPILGLAGYEGVKHIVTGMAW